MSTLGDRVLEIIARRRAEREQPPPSIDDILTRPTGFQRDPFECGMVSEETSERVAKPHETPRSPLNISVAQFYQAHQHDGRAVLSFTGYRDPEPLAWIVCIRNKFRMAAYFLCHHVKVEIRQVSPDGDISQLGVPVTVLRRAD